MYRKAFLNVSMIGQKLSNYTHFHEAIESLNFAKRLFSKSMKRKILNFLHEVEKVISVISIQV